MNGFVEQCRREWKRLGVPDPVADEMAADLAADLAEAEAEGASAEEVLGTGAFDPRSFAAAWAAERGVIRVGNGLLRRPRLPAAIGVVALAVAIAGAVLVILASPSAPRRQALELPPPPRALTPTAVWVTAAPPSDTMTIWVGPTESDDSGDDARTVGAVLLIVGLAGIAPLTVFSLWAGPGRRPLRRRIS